MVSIPSLRCESSPNIWVTEFRKLVRQCLPQALKRVSIFEDFSDDFATILACSPFYSLYQTEPSRIVDTRLGATFAALSFDLEQLSVSYMVSAEDFFQACQPPRPGKTYSLWHSHRNCSVLQEAPETSTFYSTKLARLPCGCPAYVLWCSGTAGKGMHVRSSTTPTEAMRILPGAAHGI